MIIKYKKFILYVIFACLSSFINVITYLLIYKFSNMVIISNLVAYILSFIVTFITNKKYVFKSKSRKYKKEVVCFIIMKFVSFLVDTAVLEICLYFQLSDFISKLISNCSTVFSNYFISNTWVFKNNEV